MKDTITRVKILTLCGLYFVLGAILAPLAGIQNDEALFSNPIYQNSYEFHVRGFHRAVPLMVISYIGTLKTALYWVIFHIVRPSTLTVRLPMVFLGSITICFFYVLIDKISSSRAALIGAILLATDQTFLLTNTFDWGPVAIEHFLLVTGCLLAVEFANSGRTLHLAGGSFVLGLALWNKAIFLWALTGICVAGVTVLWPYVRKRLQWRTVGIATAGFLVGASPFLIYNLKRPNATLSQNARLEIPDWGMKFIQVRSALEGRSLFGYITNEDSAEKPKQPESALGRMAVFVHGTVGERRGGIMSYVAGLCLFCVPLWWKSRIAWFSLVFSAVTWLMMAITRDAGASAHHAVLLWPFPQLFVAVTLAAIPWRVIPVLVATAVACSNLLVWNEYLYKLERFGAAQVFTDAINPLSDRVTAIRAAAPKPIMVYVSDWGIWNTLAMLHRGRLPITGIDDLFPEHPVPDQHRDEALGRVLADRDAIYLGHVASQEVFSGIGKRIDASLESAGLTRQVVEVVPDSNGRPMFEIFRVVPR